MAWFLSPSGWPTSADDGSLFALSLHARGWQILDASQVQAAIDAYKAGQPAPVPPDYVDEDEFPTRLAEQIEQALPARLSEVELRAAFDSRYGRQTPGKLSPKVGVLGDSLSVNTDTATQRHDSPLHYATLKSGGQIHYSWMGGIGGQTSAQILARVADAVASPAQTIVVLMGANDGAGAADFATVTRPNLDATVAALLAGGKTPVLCTRPPRGTAASPASAAQKLAVAQYNLYVRRLAPQLGTPLVDYYTTLADPVGDYYSSATQNDGTHPNAAGWSAMGSTLATALASQLPAAITVLPTVNNDAASLTDNCLFLNSSAGVPTGWSIAAGTTGATPTVVTATTGAGNKLRVDLASSAGQYAIWRPNIPVVAGHRLLIASRMAWSGVLARLQLDQISGGTTSYGVFRLTDNTPAAQATGAPLVWEWVVPAGVTAINAELVAQAGTGFVELSQFAIYDLTTQGQL